MSPEQVIGLAAVDPRSDIYALGVVLYEIAAGCRPFEDESAFQVMLKQRDAVPVPPSRVKPAIGTALDAVILKALEKDPASRFQSAAEFRLAIEAALAQIPAPRAMRAGRRWGIAAVLAVTAAGLALSGARYLEPKPAPAPPAMPVPRLPVPALVEPQPQAAATLAPEPPSPEPPAKARPVRSAKSALAVVKPAPQPAPAPVIPEPPRIIPAARVSTEPPLPAAASVPVSTANEGTPKRRNAVWRALGRLVRGKGATPAAETPQPSRGQPAPAYAQPAK
jgi:serine/threonine-protein kinase